MEVFDRSETNLQPANGVPDLFNQAFGECKSAYAPEATALAIRDVVLGMVAFAPGGIYGVALGAAIGAASAKFDVSNANAAAKWNCLNSRMSTLSGEK